MIFLDNPWRAVGLVLAGWAVVVLAYEGLKWWARRKADMW